MSKSSDWCFTYREEMRVRARNYYLKHRRACKLSSHKYYKKNKARLYAKGVARRKFILESTPWLNYFGWAKRRCIHSESYIKKGIKFLLTLEETKKLWFRDKAELLKRPSLDRIDSTGHYTYDNCRFIEFYYNAMRSTLDKSKLMSVVINNYQLGINTLVEKLVTSDIWIDKIIPLKTINQDTHQKIRSVD